MLKGERILNNKKFTPPSIEIVLFSREMPVILTSGIETGDGEFEF